MRAEPEGEHGLAGGSRVSSVAEAVTADILRGDIHVTTCMETLQTGYLHAVAAASGCTLAKPTPDALGTDFNIEHPSSEHTTDTIAQVRVQMKSTWGIARDKIKPGTSFSFQLENKDLNRLNVSPVTIVRLLVVLLLPKDRSLWLSAEHNALALRHCAYWVNLEGVKPTGETKTTVSVPVDHVFDDRALCAIMRKVGAGEKPR